MMFTSDYYPMTRETHSPSATCPGVPPALVLVQALAELTCCGAGARAGAANRKGSVLVQAVSPIHQGTGGDGHTRKSSLRGASRKSAGATLDGHSVEQVHAVNPIRHDTASGSAQV